MCASIPYIIMDAYKFQGELVGLRTTWLKMAYIFCWNFLSTYVTHLIKIFLLFLYNYIYCLHCSQSVDVMRDGSGNSSSSSVAAIVVPLVVLLLLTGIVVILVAVLAYQLIKYKRQSIE